MPVYDTDLIYTRVICIQQYREIYITDVLSGLRTFPSASIIIWWEWCYACSIEGSPEYYTPSWTIKSDPMSVACCHHRWMCYVVSRALAHEWHRWGLCDQLHGYHQISHGKPWRLPDIWRYVGNSTKQMTRSSRSGNDASRKQKLSLHTTLPTQNVALNVLHNKVQLINLYVIIWLTQTQHRYKHGAVSVSRDNISQQTTKKLMSSSYTT